MAAKAPLLVGAAATAALALVAGPLGAQEAAAPAEAAPAAVSTRGPVTNMPLPRFVSMRAETANARRGPSLDQRVDWTFTRRGLPLQVTAEYGNWRRVSDSEGAGGWVHHTLLSGVRTALVQGDQPAPLYAEPGAGPIRAFAEPGVVARLEGCEGAWCRLSAEGVKGWVERDVLWGLGPED